MARIRSVHPGLYTDESFATLTMAARVLIIGIWNHADDGGGFEWKPLTLKMRIFPADNIDVSELLAELEANDIVKKYDVDGKIYGAVRNFGKWQKPKKPSRFFPMPEHVRKYACTNEGEKETGSEPDVGKQHNEEMPIQDECGTSSEPVPNQCGISISEGRKGGREEGNNSLTLRSRESGELSPSTPPAKPNPRGCRLPADWTPTDADRAFALGLGLNPSDIAPQFADFWHAKAGAGGVKLDWAATWRGWCRRDAEKRGSPKPIAGKPQSPLSQQFERMQRQYGDRTVA